MNKEAAICFGCMSEKNYDGVCKECGYSDTTVVSAAYLAPGSTLSERYIVGKLMSYNGEGALYMALDTEKNKKVTIKEYMPDTLCDRGADKHEVRVKPEKLPLYKTYLAEFVELNRNLMNVDRSLSVQPVLDVFSENRTAYVVYEYITGLSLKSYLAANGGKLSWEETKELFGPVLTALAVANSSGVTHRGISPATLLVNNQHRIQIIGFEIAASRTFGSEIDFQVFAGYAPIELYNAAARQGAWTDVYSVCAVLYRVLTGMQPQDSASRERDDTLTEPALLDRDIPQNVSVAIMRGLSLKPAMRMRTVSDLAEQLFNSEATLADVTRDLSMHKLKEYAEQNEAIRRPLPKSTSGNVRATAKSKKRRHSAFLTYGLLIVAALLIIGCIIGIIYPNVRGNNEPQETDLPTITETRAPVTTAITAFSTAESTSGGLFGDTSEPLYKMPDFSGRQYELIQKSQGYNFLQITAEFEYNEDFTAGTVYEQSIEKGTEVKYGAELVLKVSKGDGYVALPEYEGVTATDYKKMLSELGIKYQTWKEYSDDVPEGIITRCSAEVGDLINVREGQQVEIYYSRGPRE